MTTIVYLFICAGAVAFVAGSLARAVRYARAPIHLRWELYPVPHEEPERAEHGGSYFEQTDWWTLPFRVSFWGELKVMVPEMLFLKALWEFNRPMWFRSFPFHFGLYLTAGSVGLAVLTALLMLLAPGIAAGPIAVALAVVCEYAGLTGAVLAIVGAVGLLQARLTDDKLRDYTTPEDVFNLLFFAVTFALLIAGFVMRPAGAANGVALASGLLTYNSGVTVSALTAAGLIAGSLLCAYIPLTHMSHFVAKYFTYHSVRWDDEPLSSSAKTRAEIARYLTYRPTWAARHLAADGSRTWAEIATTPPPQELRK